MNVQMPYIPESAPPMPEPDTNGMLDRLRAYTNPQHAVSQLAGMDTLTAVLVLGAGLIYLLQGWKIFKILVVVNAAILGVLVGNYLGGLLQGEKMPLFGSLAGAVLLGVLAWPLMKYAVSAMGALAGSFMGYALWHYLVHAVGSGQLDRYAWVGALLGLVTLGLLAFVIFRIVIEVFTSVQGAVCAVAGILALLLKFDRTSESLKEALTGNLHLMPLLVIVVAVIGFALQHAGLGMKGKKKPEPAKA